MKTKNGIILLSSGMDSLVALDFAKNFIKIELALTFDYGQKALIDEIESSKLIANLYNIPHRVIKIPFLKEISNNALIEDNISLEVEKMDRESAKNVWIPNRNGLFINIAASFADRYKYDYIILGLNREEAENFPDNSLPFIQRANDFFQYSTMFHPQIYAPLYNLTKKEIVKLAIANKVDFSLIKSCYNTSTNGKKHCGKCESCIRLKNAIIETKNEYLLKILF